MSLKHGEKHPTAFYQMFVRKLWPFEKTEPIITIEEVISIVEKAREFLTYVEQIFSLERSSLLPQTNKSD
jgi:hypothetical protein